MTNEKAFEIIGERAEALARNEKIKAKMQSLYEQGYTIEQIKGAMYQMAVATLVGNVGE